MPLGTPFRASLTVVESVDCSSETVSVAVCPAMVASQGHDANETVYCRTIRPPLSVECPVLDKLGGPVQGGERALDAAAEERECAARLDLGLRILK